jgi:hypothetical protein
MIVRNSKFWTRQLTSNKSSLGSMSPVNFDWRRAKWLRVSGKPPSVIKLPTWLRKDGERKSFWHHRTMMVIPLMKAGIKRAVKRK